jgi:hypothetical protein
MLNGTETGFGPADEPLSAWMMGQQIKLKKLQITSDDTTLAVKFMVH